jgi:hypothetical protein
MNLLLPVILVIRFWTADGFTSVHYERFETEYQCQQEVRYLKGIPAFKLSCEVET